METRNKKHWIIVALLCGLSASSVGLCNNCVGIFYTPVSEALGIYRGTFAMHATLSLLATACTSLMMRKIINDCNYKKILILGVAMSVLSTIAMAYSSTVYMFYLLGIIRGIGSGLYATSPITMIITNWFHDKHGTATSIALSFSGLSGAICSPVLANCIHIYGWKNAYLIMAAMILVFTLPALLYPFSVHPEDCGLLPYGYVEQEKKQVTQKVEFNYFQLGFLCMCIFTLLHTSITGISQHLSGYGQSLGFSVTVGAALLSCSMVGNIVTKLIIGVLSDMVKPVKACFIMIVVNMCSLVGLLMFRSEVFLYAAALVYGSVYSVGAVGIPLLTKYFFGQENYTKTYSVIGFLTSVGSASSLPLIGYVYDFTGAYSFVFVCALGIHIFNMCLLTILIKRKQRS
ncbi:MAG: MFS transporter [Firmicutes bacterium]|nr:MFS transporter [Bacillota bacterium]